MSKIEQFTAHEFEKELPVHKGTGELLWGFEGLRDGERQYRVTVDEKTVLIVRSSIGASGIAAASGQDSIRIYLARKDNGKPIAVKLSKWTTRVPGWGDRMKEKMREFVRLRKAAGNDRNGEPMEIFKVKKAGPNKGRLFAKSVSTGEFIWLTAVEAGETRDED